MKSSVLWEVAPCSLLEVYQHFETNIWHTPLGLTSTPSKQQENPEDGDSSSQIQDKFYQVTGWHISANTPFVVTEYLHISILKK
jgi:hypothetical protein